MSNTWNGPTELDGPKVNASGKGLETAMGTIKIKAGKLIVKGMVMSKDLGYITDLQRIVFVDSAKGKAEFHFAGGSVWKVKGQKKGELERFTQELQKGLEGLSVTHEVKKSNAGKTVGYVIGAIVILALISAIFSDPDKGTGTRTMGNAASPAKTGAEMPNIAPQYKIVKRDSDSNYANIVRKGIRITIPKGLDHQTAQANLEHAAWTVYRESNPNAVMVFAYHPGDDVDGSFTVGRCVLAPNGKWEEADSDAPMKAVVDFTDSFESTASAKTVQPPKPSKPAKPQKKAEPRSGMTMTTKEGYVASTSIEKLEKAIEYVVQGDKAAFDAFINQNPDVIVLKGGMEVFIADTKILSGKVKIRPKGRTTEVWTVIEAVE